MPQIYSNTITELNIALEHVAGLDISDMARDFEVARAGEPGLYHALEYNPRTGQYHVTSEASWACSADEYFGEHGVLSRITLLSRNATHYRPGPEDGFEWKDDENGEYVTDSNYTGWTDADDLDSILDHFQDEDDEQEFDTADEAIAALNLIRFTVDPTAPVNGWDTSTQEEEIKDSLAGLGRGIVEAIREAEGDDDDDDDETENSPSE